MSETNSNDKIGNKGGELVTNKNVLCKTNLIVCHVEYNDMSALFSTFLSFHLSEYTPIQRSLPSPSLSLTLDCQPASGPVLHLSREKFFEADADDVFLQGELQRVEPQQLQPQLAQGNTLTQVQG